MLDVQPVSRPHGRDDVEQRCIALSAACWALIGVLPGIGPIATIAMLLPATFTIGDPTASLIMLAGIYYGAQYGGSTTAIW